MNKKIILLIILLPVVYLYAQSKTVIQYVRNWPAEYDTTGKHWVIYQLYNPETHVLNETSVGSGTNYVPNPDNYIAWIADPGNFNGGVNAWTPGDTLVVLGSMDTAYVSDPDNYGTNSNHTGFYWLFTDTVTTEDIQIWLPADTLRVLPKPIATQVGWPTGNIQISITNPAETRRVDQTEYDVMGYWIWADTTSGTHHDTAGRPDYFDLEVGFFSVDGDPGEITICTHSDSIYHDEQTVYWAYKLVARPSFSLKGSRQAPGHTTYYLSQNSNPLTNIGIEENTSLNPGCVKLEISPNPFTDRTDITCSIGQSAKGTELRIYDISGKLVKDFFLPTAYSIVPTVIPWDGTDESGEQLPSGVYFIQAKGGDFNLTKKVILQR